MDKSRRLSCIASNEGAVSVLSNKNAVGSQSCQRLLNGTKTDPEFVRNVALRRQLVARRPIPIGEDNEDGLTQSLMQRIAKSGMVTKCNLRRDALFLDGSRITCTPTLAASVGKFFTIVCSLLE